MKRRIETKDDFHRMRFRCRRKIVLFFLLCLAAFLILAGRTLWVCVFQSSYYTQKAKELHERERSIKAARGRILDRNGTVLAENKSVCTISVIHNQIEDCMPSSGTRTLGEVPQEKSNQTILNRTNPQQCGSCNRRTDPAVRTCRDQGG